MQETCKPKGVLGQRHGAVFSSAAIFRKNQNILLSWDDAALVVLNLC